MLLEHYENGIIDKIDVFGYKLIVCKHMQIKYLNVLYSVNIRNILLFWCNVRIISLNVRLNSVLRCTVYVTLVLLHKHYFYTVVCNSGFVSNDAIEQ